MVYAIALILEAVLAIPLWQSVIAVGLITLIYATSGGMKAVVYGDAILLQNAIRNVIDNALKYSPAESEVHISVSNKAENRISITDQGPGFPPDEIDNLANRFTRGQNSEGITGSGLGLTIAQDVIAAHDGKMTLSNQPSGGACVTFSF